MGRPRLLARRDRLPRRRRTGDRSNPQRNTHHRGHRTGPGPRDQRTAAGRRPDRRSDDHGDLGLSDRGRPGRTADPRRCLSGRFDEPLEITADLAPPDIVSNDLVTARAGFLGLTLGAEGVQGSSIQLDADVTVALTDPGGQPAGTITLAEFQEHGTDLGTQTGAAQIDIGLYGISGIPGVANDPATPAFVQLDDKRWDESERTLADNFTLLGVADFLETNSEEVRNLLVQFEGFLTSASSSSLFGTSIPLTKDRELADVVNLGGFFNEHVMGLLVEPQPGAEDFARSNFTTIQELAERLSSSLENLTYDPVGKQLQFDIGLSSNLESIEDTIEIFDIAPLSGLTTEGIVSLDPTADLQLRFSMLLTEIGSNIGPITESTPVNELNRGRGIRTNEDETWHIGITLSNGDYFKVDLTHDENATLGDIIGRIEVAVDDPSKFEIRINASQSGLELVDRTQGNQTFSVSEPDGSSTLYDLGLLGKIATNDDAGEQLISGQPLHGDTLNDHFGVRDSSIDISFDLAGQDIAAEGRWGDLAVSIEDGSVRGSVAIGMVLKDPETDAADGLATIRELNTGLNTPVDLFAPATTGQLGVDLPLYPNPAFAGLGSSETLPVFHAVLPYIQHPETLTVELTPDPANDIAPLLAALTDISVGEVLAGARESADYVVELERSSPPPGVPDSLSRVLPGIGRSVGELLPMGSTWRSALHALPTPDTLQDLESVLASLAQVDSVTPSFDAATSALFFDFQLTGEMTESLPFELDLTSLDLTSQGATLADLGLDVIGMVAAAGESGLIDVHATANHHIPLGIDLSTFTPTAFLSDTTQLAYEVVANQPQLDFAALFGVLGVDISDGTFALDADGSGTSIEPARFAFQLDDVPGDRHPLATAATATTATVTGVLNVDLPVDFRGLASNQPDIEVVIGDLGDPAGTTTLAGPDVAGVLAELSLDDILPSFAMGCDWLLDELADQLNRVVFGMALPIVGEGMATQFDVFQQIREKVVDNLDDLSVVTPTLIEQALRDALGGTPELGLGWLADDSDVTKTIETEQELVFEMRLDVPLREFDLPTDLNLPGLGLELLESGTAAIAASQVQYDVAPFTLTLGISPLDGVFIDVSQVGELAVELKAELPDSADATIRSFPYTAEDTTTEQGVYDLTGAYSIDLTDGEQNNRLNWIELRLGEDATLIDASFSGSAQFDLQLQTSLPPVTLENAGDRIGSSEYLQSVTYGHGAFPTFRYDLDVDWTFADTDSAIGDSMPERVVMSNVEFDLIRFLKDFLLPAVRKHCQALAPFEDILVVMNSRIFGEGAKGLPWPANAAWVDLVLLLEGVNQTEAFAQTAKEMRQLNRWISGLAASDADPLWIDLGDYDLDGDVARGTSRGQLLLDEQTQRQ